MPWYYRRYYSMFSLIVIRLKMWLNGNVMLISML